MYCVLFQICPNAWLNEVLTYCLEYNLALACLIVIILHFTRDKLGPAACASGCGTPMRGRHKKAATAREPCRTRASASRCTVRSYFRRNAH